MATAAIHGITSNPEIEYTSHAFSHFHPGILFIGATKLPFRMRPTRTPAIPYAKSMVSAPYPSSWSRCVTS